jgi:hypothetical protein
LIDGKGDSRPDRQRGGGEAFAIEKLLAALTWSSIRGSDFARVAGDALNLGARSGTPRPA